MNHKYSLGGDKDDTETEGSYYESHSQIKKTEGYQDIILKASTLNDCKTFFKIIISLIIPIFGLLAYLCINKFSNRQENVKGRQKNEFLF